MLVNASRRAVIGLHHAAAKNGQRRFLNVHEYISMALMKEYGIAVPKGSVASTPKEVRQQCRISIAADMYNSSASPKDLPHLTAMRRASITLHPSRPRVYLSRPLSCPGRRHSVIHAAGNQW